MSESVCACGHVFDEHDAGECQAEVERRSFEWVPCLCMEFEEDPEP